uniref:RING-type domain-containing protein n=1 Tax=Setaria digitata TaxID=48799 RepID=A0A915PIW4_9BILA
MEEENAIFCSICLGPGSWPKARPSVCRHSFCYLCISNWVERRSECPLCKRSAKVLIVISEDGREYKISVKERTGTQYQGEIGEEHTDLFQETEDITVVYARCQVCNSSENEHLLLLCDGIVGQNLDGSSIRCNAACHCYCLPEKLGSVPKGDWFCPFCVNIRTTQKSVHSSRDVRQECRSSSHHQLFKYDIRECEFVNEDEPGPSRMNRSTRLRSCVNVFNRDEFLTGSTPDRANDVIDERMESDSNFSLKKDFSREGDSVWDNQDSIVLETDSDVGYDPAGLTEVTKRKKRMRQRKKNSKRVKKKRRIRKEVKHFYLAGNIAEINIRKKNSWKKNIRKRKGATGVQKRLAEVIGLDLFTDRRRKRERTKRSLQSTEYRNDKVSGEKTVEETDLIASIMSQQAKTLASTRYQRMVRNGINGETVQMIKQGKVVEKVAVCKELASSEAVKDSDENIPMYSASSSHNEAKEKRKKRPSRWGTPTTSKSHDNTIITASIPLPLGPPLTQAAVALENIPVPSTDQQPQSQVALPSRPSALNTAPSTSFALKSTAMPSFGVASGQSQISLAPFAGSGLGQQHLGLSQQSLVALGQQQLTNLGQQTLAGLSQQPVPGLSQPQLTPIGQGSLVQMQPSLLPNFFLPPLNISAMNGLLAAGLLANNSSLTAPPMTQPLSQPSSATPAPFMLNPVQFSAASAQQLNQHFVNLATSLQRNVDTAVDPVQQLPQQPPKQPEGVPPPPPVIKPPESSSTNISLCEPLAEKIRKLIEASNVRPLCDSSVEDNATVVPTVQDEVNNVVLCDDSKAGESGRKSASADDEETGEAVKTKRFHKNGAMFEEARRMLSSSLKKVYRLKQITKQEYKEIMKKGVTALSQRTKLDQKKVDDYAAKSRAWSRLVRRCDRATHLLRGQPGCHKDYNSQREINAKYRI